MSSRIIPRSASALARASYRPHSLPSTPSITTSSTHSRPIHSTPQTIDSDTTQPTYHPPTATPPPPPSRSPYPVLPRRTPTPFSKPAHSPQYDPTRAPLQPPTTLERPALPQHLLDTLPLLAAQTPHYATIHIHGKPYLVTQGDTLRLPFLMHGVAPGDVLRLNRASLLGSREWTLQGGTLAARTASDSPAQASAAAAAVVEAEVQAEATAASELVVGRTDGLQETAAPAAPVVDETAGLRKTGPAAFVDGRLYAIRAVVVGTESEPLRVKEKKKQRNRHVRHVKSKHRFTVLRISELTVRDASEVAAEVGGEAV